MLKLSNGGKTVTGTDFGKMISEFREVFKGLVYTPKEIKSIMMYAGAVGGRVFVDVFLPKRFETEYAHVMWYFVSDEYETWKERNVGKLVSLSQIRGGKGGNNYGKEQFVMAAPQPTPFYASGRSKKSVLDSAYVVVVATKGDLRISVKCNSAAINFTPQYGAFSKVLEFEKKRVAQEVDRTLRLHLVPDAKEAKARGDRLPELVTRYSNQWGKQQMRNINASFLARAV